RGSPGTGAGRPSRTAFRIRLTRRSGRQAGGIVRAMAMYANEAKIVAEASRRRSPLREKPRRARIQMRRRDAVATRCAAGKASTTSRLARALRPNPMRRKALEARNAERPKRARRAARKSRAAVGPEGARAPGSEPAALALPMRARDARDSSLRGSEGDRSAGRKTVVSASPRLAPPWANWIRFAAPETEGGASLRGGRLLGLELPEDIDDFPVAVVPCDLEVVDPVGGDDLDDRRVLVPVEDGDVLRLGFLRRLAAAAGPGVLDEGHGAHRVEARLAARGVGVDDALGELGMESALHACGVALVPPLDVIESGLADRRRLRVRRGLRFQRSEREKQEREAGLLHGNLPSRLLRTPLKEVSEHDGAGGASPSPTTPGRKRKGRGVTAGGWGGGG